MYCLLARVILLSTRARHAYHFRWRTSAPTFWKAIVPQYWNIIWKTSESKIKIVRESSLLYSSFKFWCWSSNVSKMMLKKTKLALLLLCNIKEDFQAPCADLQSKPREDMLVDTFSTHLLKCSTGHPNSAFLYREIYGGLFELVPGPNIPKQDAKMKISSSPTPSRIDFLKIFCLRWNNALKLYGEPKIWHLYGWK